MRATGAGCTAAGWSFFLQFSLSLDPNGESKAHTASIPSQNLSLSAAGGTVFLSVSSVCVQGFLEYVLFWVPFYYPIKLAFLFFLFLPQTQVLLPPTSLDPSP